MSSGMTNLPNVEQGTLGLMEDLAEMLRAEVFPTHQPLIQLIGKLCEDPALKQVDLYSKYTRLAAVVGGDWITVKEELLNATRFGAPAFYCSISAMLAVFTCRRSRSHDELVSSLTELYNHISAGNEALNKQVENAITTMGRQMEHANVPEASIANLNECIDNAITTMDNKQEELYKRAEEGIARVVERADKAISIMDKHEEQLKTAEARIANMIEHVDNCPGETSTSPLAITNSEIVVEQDNVKVIGIPGTAFRCKYGTLVIDDQSQCTFIGNSLEAKILAYWLTLPIPLYGKAIIMNRNLDKLISFSMINYNLSFIEGSNLEDLEEKEMLYNYIDNYFKTVPYTPGQWCYISRARNIR